MSHSKTRTLARSPYQVQVLDRALAILDLLSFEGPDLSLGEVSDKLELHKSTVHRLIMVLERHKLIERNSLNGRYRLGLKLFELGTRAVSQLDLRERARPVLERLVLETSETVHLGILDDTEVLYLDKVEPARSVRMSSSVGRRNPAYCTAMGKSILAYLTEAQVEAIVRKHGLKAMTANTITSLLELKAELAGIRERGYAVDNEEIEEGVRCVGCVVRDFSGGPVAAISVSAPAFRISREKAKNLSRPVIAAANTLSAELGYKQEKVALAEATIGA
ncbi:MAG TPA: IclR family transcriptional regulator [Candidatus Angelobacter sp.]|nr:IclR family transcriptional regulator [Candidatus Angelobacter sp.]